MSKRKRSWDAAHSQPGFTAMTQYGGADFGQTTLATATAQPSSSHYNKSTSTSFPMEMACIDQRVRSSASNGEATEAVWRQATPLNPSTNIIPENLAVPAVTRKITACATCRKQKIKCEMPNDNPPCVRCSRRGLSCVLNKSLQTLLDDAKQTEVIQSDIQSLYETLEVVCRKLDIPKPRPLALGRTVRSGVDTNALSSDNDQDCELSPPTSPSAVQAPIDTFLEVTKLGSPTSPDTPQSLRQHRSSTSQHRDLVSKGLIPLPVAEALAERYFSRLDHYLYGIGSSLGNLKSLQRTSPILVAAICTVSALHDPQNQSIYELCNREFRRLVSRSVFEKRGLDHLQALCIGSFWLTDASRILSSDAHRRAADARLHKHFQQLIDPVDGGSSSPLTLSSEDLANRIRLWYLLFICDQHLSILHNRDPLLRTDKEILANCDAFLERDGATDADVRLLSQVLLLLIMGQVRDIFGSELDDRPAKGLSVQLSNFSKQLDRWYARFSKLFKPNPHIGDFPMKGLQLHYQFSKLYLGHHVFKGLKGEAVPAYFFQSACMARDAAIEIFEMIFRDQELQQSLVGMPHYFHIMIAFAGHFLLEISNKYHEQLSIDLQQTLDLLGKVLTLFQNLACIPQHPIARMTGGLARKLLDSSFLVNGSINLENPPNMPHTPVITDPGPPRAFTTSSIPVSQTSQPTVFDPGFEQMQNHPNNHYVFSDFEQFSFPDMTMNFMP